MSDPWSIRARQLQRFHADGPGFPTHHLIKRDDLRRAALLSPDFRFKDPTADAPEPDWPTPWESNPKSLTSTFNHPNWRAFPVGDVSPPPPKHRFPRLPTIPAPDDGVGAGQQDQDEIDGAASESGESVGGAGQQDQDDIAGPASESGESGATAQPQQPQAVRRWTDQDYRAFRRWLASKGYRLSASLRQTREG
ncbi:hypothetical protein QBC39DRAFT_364438 [Podospora conica]|nr:hypothetical protein QBC39DRAFT_364438 [Schizothecium conicum]